jgi:hypothetical protein
MNRQSFLNSTIGGYLVLIIGTIIAFILNIALATWLPSSVVENHLYPYFVILIYLIAPGTALYAFTKANKNTFKAVNILGFVLSLIVLGYYFLALTSIVLYGVN